MTDICEPFGPAYDLDSAALKKARRGNDRKAHGQAVLEAVRAANAALLRREAPSMPKPTCASGTYHNNGADILKAVRQQHRAALLACPSKIRRERSPAEWRAMYDAAMAEKRAREATPEFAIAA